jgi:hypothetical protein
MTELANNERSDPHALIPRKPVDIKFVQALPDAKRIALLVILTRTDFVDSPNFRSQVASSETPSSNIQRPILRIITLEERSNAIPTPSSSSFANLLRRRTQTSARGLFLPRFTNELLRELLSTSAAETR